MKRLEKLLKVYANARRLTILTYLGRVHEATVGDIAKEINLSFKSTSRHLHVLFAADCVEKDQRSLEVYYRLAPSALRVTRTILGIK